MYLIIGGSGFLGRYCIKNVLEKTNENIIATYSNSLPQTKENPRVKWCQLNITDINAVNKIGENVNNDTKIIYLAAFHHPDKVEEFPETAWNINIVALANAVNAFHNAKCFYYASTDSVYGEGTKDTKFIESDKYAPVNLYGKNKVLALDKWARDNKIIPNVIRAYSDSKSDMPIMEIAREQVWIDSKTGLRRGA